MIIPIARAGMAVARAIRRVSRPRDCDLDAEGRTVAEDGVGECLASLAVDADAELAPA